MPHAAERPDRQQFVVATLIMALVMVLALLAAPLASRYIAGSGLEAGALLGGNSIMDVMIALVLYSRGRVAGDADSVALGHLFLFAGGFFAVHAVNLGGGMLGLAVPFGYAAENRMWLIWTGFWLCGVAFYGWTSDPAAERRPIKRQIARMVAVVAVAVLATVLLSQAALHLPLDRWVPGAATPLLCLLTVAGWVGVTHRLARHSLGALWLSVILVIGLADLTLRALGAGRDNFGTYAGTCALLAVKLLVFTSLFRGLVARLRQMSEASTALELMAHHDALTGLANRRRFDQRLTTEWRRCARDRAPLALILIDVDKFKQLNDLYGHPAGDSCLIKLASLLAAYVRRPGDLAARYGGEEFVLLLPGTDAEGAATLAERIRRALRRLAIPHEGSAQGVVTLSAGVAATMAAGADRHALTVLLAADEALYRAKSFGRDRVEVAPATPALGQQSAGDTALAG